MPKRLKPTTQSERSELIKQQLKTAPELSNRTIARSLGVSHTTVGKIREIMASSVQTGRLDTQDVAYKNHPYLREHPEILDGLSARGLRALRAEGVLDVMMASGSKSPVYAQRLLRQHIKAANRTAPERLNESDIKVFQADLRNGLPEIADGSVNLVLVDPPYQKSAVPLYADIAAVSGRILRDGGSLLCMTGQSHLPDVLAELTTNKTALRYQWTLAYVTPMRSRAVWERKALPRFKPIIWLVKGEYSGDLITDTIYASSDMESDKEHHHWGQSVQSMIELISKFTDEGQTVCDMCVGGGSTAVAAVQCGRRFIGCDISIECVRVTKKRIGELFGDIRRK